MRSVRWRWAQTTILAALTLVVLVATLWLGAAPTKSDDPPRAPAALRTDPVEPTTLYATVEPTPTRAPPPSGFLGLSLEYSALEAYTGADPAALDPVFVQLLRNLTSAAGQPLVLRIGGNSTDATWWPLRGVSPPGGVRYALTPGWLATTRALAGAVGSRLILGVNLAAGRPRLAGAEARALLRGIGRRYVAALEVGNEPDVYGVFPWYSEPRRPRRLVFARPAGYDLPAFIGQLRRWQAALPPMSLAGPAVAELPWMSGLPSLLEATPRLRVVTIHRYPIKGCLNDRSSLSYPSVANLLSDRAAGGLAAAIAPYVALAHSHVVQFRVDELNSAALAGCLGRAGVSNTFASALWMADALFNLASVGVDGVNVHTLPGAAYELFTFRRTAAGWQAFVHPDYYGMLLFAQAFPAGARLLSVHAPAGPVKVWATRDPAGRIRVALINKDSRPHEVELQLPPASTPAELEWLRALAPTATERVTLGGQTFGPETTTGRLPAPRLETVAQLFGWYSIALPPTSAALLTR
jgi:hypothetical protein